MRRWRLRPKPVISTTMACMPDEVANRPQITPAMVLNAFRRIPLPHPRTLIQPAHTTLVNLDTIFHTNATPFTTTVTLLGQHIRLWIHPATYTWTYGDGTTATTTTPGTAYPAKTIVHRYPHAHIDVAAHVAITWAADYTVNGQPRQPVPGTATSTGPDTTLHIAEAVPALSGEGH